MQKDRTTAAEVPCELRLPFWVSILVSPSSRSIRAFLVLGDKLRFDAIADDLDFRRADKRSSYRVLSFINELGVVPVTKINFTQISCLRFFSLHAHLIAASLN